MPHSAFDRIACCSRFGRRLLTAQPQLAEATARQLGEAIRAFVHEPPCADEAALLQRLRQLRQRVWLVANARDLAGTADLAEIVSVILA